MGITLSQAAQLVGKNRKTLYRHITEGRLSATINADGVKEVDPSELHRVYGELRDIETGQKKTVPPDEIDKRTGGNGEIEALKAHIESLKEAVSQCRDDLLNEKRRVDQLTGMLATSGRLIEDQRKPEPPKQTEKSKSKKRGKK